MEANELIQNRNKTFDLVKGITMFFVLWGHLIQYTLLNQYDYFSDKVFVFIYSFHMPLFAIVSGYFLYNSVQGRKMYNVILRKIKNIGQPLIVWSTIQYLIYSVFDLLKFRHISLSIKAWWDFFTGMYLWFLWSILVCSIVIIIISKVVINKWIQCLLFIAAAPVLCVFPNPQMNLFIYPFILAGFFIKRYEAKGGKIYKENYFALVIVVPVFLILLLFYSKEMFIYVTGITYTGIVSLREQFLIDLYRYMIGFIGSYAVFIVVKKLEHFIPQKISVFIENCGRQSLSIYILQSVLITGIYSKIAGIVFKEINIENRCQYDFIMFIAAISLLFVLSYIGDILLKFDLSARILFGVTGEKTMIRISSIISTAWNISILRLKGIDPNGVNITGFLHLQGRPQNFVIDKNVRIVSRRRTNPLGGGTCTFISMGPEAEIEIQEGTGISNSFFRIKKGIKIGKNVNIGGDCKFYDSDMHSIDYDERMRTPDLGIKTEPIIIQDGVWIGAHSIILKGVKIGERSVIGAGSVVTKSIPADELWAGNPAKFVRKINKK